jgi:hypothetical protein
MTMTARKVRLAAETLRVVSSGGYVARAESDPSLVRHCHLSPCRLPSLTWESGFPCHPLNRRLSDVVVVNLGGQSPSAELHG